MRIYSKHLRLKNYDLLNVYVVDKLNVINIALSFLSDKLSINIDVKDCKI